ncbi:MAG: dependent oxidoreductase [Thermomicrobiales bacterium]|nr:dependent oxidoreductase [Thermomicrobiales bacterium]
MSLLQPVKRARQRSLWLQEALAREPEAETVEPLSGGHRTDVCVVGGGYTGLWTALQIKWLDPSVGVMLLEADICGGGASGRNGGIATSWWQKLSLLIDKYGDEEGMRLAQESAAAVVAIGRVCAEYGIDADFRPAGVLITATAPAHIGAWNDAVRATRDRGIDVFSELAPAEVARRAGSPMHLSGIWDRSGARIQPALLARGLRRIAREQGVQIWEQTPVVEVLRGRPPVLRTPFGAVVAEKVVLATNAWLCALPEIRRAVLPMSSDMIATAPIPERLAGIGWTGDECVADEHMMVHYYRTTEDGRIAFGKGGCSHAYLGRITQAFEDPGPRLARTERSFRRIYPALRDVPITHSWTGPIDRSETNSPFFGHLDRNPDILYGVGYSGTGVGPSYLGGRILASTALERRDEWQESPINRGPRSLYPYDPIRYFGGNIVRAAVLRKEADLNAGRASTPVVELLNGFVPSGLRGTKPDPPTHH